MSDTIIKWHKMEEEEKAQAVEQLKQLEERALAEAAEQYNKGIDTFHKAYIWVLDFTDGKVYSYKVPNGVNKLDSFIIGEGQNLNNGSMIKKKERKKRRQNVVYTQTFTLKKRESPLVQVRR